MLKAEKPYGPKFLPAETQKKFLSRKEKENKARFGFDECLRCVPLYMIHFLSSTFKQALVQTPANRKIKINIANIVVLKR